MKAANEIDYATRLKSKTWYRAAVIDSPLGMRLPQVVLDSYMSNTLFMIIEHGFCQFYTDKDGVNQVYSCTARTAKKKFLFERLT
jgi:hypothetical protein